MPPRQLAVSPRDDDNVYANVSLSTPVRPECFFVDIARPGYATSARRVLICTQSIGLRARVLVFA